MKPKTTIANHQTPETGSFRAARQANAVDLFRRLRRDPDYEGDEEKLFTEIARRITSYSSWKAARVDVMACIRHFTKDAVDEAREEIDESLYLIQDVALQRYRDGTPVIVKFEGAAIRIDDIKEYHTEDARVFLEVLKQRAQLFGLNAAVKSEVLLEQRPYKTMTDEELDAAIVAEAALIKE